MDTRDLGVSTRAIHGYRDGGREGSDAGYGAIVEPIITSTTFLRDADGSYPHGHIYTRSSNPNRATLERALATLEGGAVACAFASGSAAMAAALLALAPGDHVVAPQTCYYGLRVLLGEVLKRWGLNATFVDTRDPENVRRAMTPATRLVWTETPANPLLDVTDLAAVAALGRAAGAIVACDNTFATPVLQRPLALGCDLVMHSTTKAIGGHSDMLGGALILREVGPLSDRLRGIQVATGGVPSPFDAWLALRGIKTLPLRIRAMSQTALQLAQFLADHPGVSDCFYPGLQRHPGHAVAAAQMHGGFGPVLSFRVRGGRAAAYKVAARVELIRRATSLGGVETTIEHRASVEGAASSTPDDLLRMSVGLEDAADLLRDLKRALEP